jgi:hypothetical protein
MLTGPREAVGSTLRARQEIQRLVALLAVVFIEVRATVRVLSEDLGNRGHSAGGVLVIAFGVERTIDLDLDGPASLGLLPEPGRSSLHVSSDSLRQGPSWRKSSAGSTHLRTRSGIGSRDTSFAPRMPFHPPRRNSEVQCYDAHEEAMATTTRRVACEPGFDP